MRLRSVYGIMISRYMLYYFIILSVGRHTHRRGRAARFFDAVEPASMIPGIRYT